MSKNYSYRELEIWQIAMQAAETVYELIKLLPDEERFGLASQLRRAAVSVPSNIAEGWGKGTQPHLANSIRTARGSACELETQLELGRRLGYLNEEQIKRFRSLIESFGQKSYAFLAKIDTSYVREDQALFGASE